MYERPDKPLAWLPFSIAEAALSDGLTTTLGPGAGVVVSAGPAARSSAGRGIRPGELEIRVDLAAGMRHLLVLLAAGIDEVLRFDPDPILSVPATSTDDT